MGSNLGKGWRGRYSACSPLATIERIVQRVCIIRKRILSNAQTFARSLQGYSLEEIDGGVDKLPSPLDADDNSIDGNIGSPKDIPLEMLIEEIRRRGMMEHLRQSQIHGLATLLGERAADLAKWKCCRMNQGLSAKHMQFLSQGKAKMQGQSKVTYSKVKANQSQK